MMAEDKDVRIIALKCPNCGGALRVPEGTNTTYCEHCHTSVLVVDAQDGQPATASTIPVSPEEAAAARRTVKIVLWIIVLAVVLPVAATVIVNIIIGLVSLVVGIVLTVTAK